MSEKQQTTTLRQCYKRVRDRAINNNDIKRVDAGGFLDFYSSIPTLQQLWQDDKGNSDWRDIETVYEENPQ